MARKEPLVYYQPDIETMSREDLEALQLERLQALVKRVYQKIPFYKESFDKAGINPQVTCRPHKTPVYGKTGYA